MNVILCDIAFENLIKYLPWHRCCAAATWYRRVRSGGRSMWGSRRSDISELFIIPWQDITCPILWSYLDEWANKETRGPKGHISCTWVQCATFLTERQGQPFLYDPKTQIWYIKTLKSCFLSSFVEFLQQFQRRSRKCLCQSETRAAILFFWSAQKTQIWQRTLWSCFLSCFTEFRSVVSEEKSKMSQPIKGQGGHIVFPIGRKNTKLGRGR